jgi:hypothetical protein
MLFSSWIRASTVVIAPCGAARPGFSYAQAAQTAGEWELPVPHAS